MHPIASEDRVQLLEEIAEFELHQGDVGIVRTSWYFPTVAFEVEFTVLGKRLRLLLLGEQICHEQEHALTLSR